MFLETYTTCDSKWWKTVRWDFLNKFAKGKSQCDTYRSTSSKTFIEQLKNNGPILTIDFYLEKSIILRDSTAWTYVEIAYGKNCHIVKCERKIIIFSNANFVRWT